MRRIWYALIIAAIVASLCIFETSIVNRTVGSIENNIDAVLNAVENGNYEKATEYSERMMRDWNSSVKSMNFLLSHDVTDKICDNIYSVYVLSKNRNNAQLSLYAEKLRLSLKVLKESEEIEGENIF